MEPLSHLVFRQTDTYLNERYWFRGWHIGLDVNQFVHPGFEAVSFSVRCISDGLTGPETVLVLEEVKKV